MTNISVGKLHSIAFHACKMKMSLIPIIGKGLSYLFGTATESDLNTILDNITKV